MSIYSCYGRNLDYILGILLLRLHNIACFTISDKTHVYKKSFCLRSSKRPIFG